MFAKLFRKSPLKWFGSGGPTLSTGRPKYSAAGSKVGRPRKKHRSEPLPQRVSIVGKLGTLMPGYSGDCQLTEERLAGSIRYYYVEGRRRLLMADDLATQNQWDEFCLLLLHASFQ